MNRLYEPQYHQFATPQPRPRRNLTKKIIGVIGIFAIVVVAVLFLSRTEAPSLANFLPNERTLVYAEIPTTLNQRGADLLKNLAPQFTSAQNLPQLTQSITLAVITTELEATEPLVFFTPVSDEARTELTTLFSKNKNFVYSNEDFLVVASADAGQKIVNEILLESPTNQLSKNSTFKEAHTKRNEVPYFAFAQPRLNPRYFTSTLEQLSPVIPFNTEIPESISAQFMVTEDTIQGAVTTPHERTATNAQKTFEIMHSGEPAYNALHLPFLPIDPDVFMGGASLATLINASLATSDSSNISESLMKEYFPETTYADDAEKLLTGEFGYALKRTSTGEGFIATIELPTLAGTTLAARQNTIAPFIAHFADGLKTRAYREEPFTLKDGGTAYEKILDPSRVALKKTESEISVIWTINDGLRPLYVAIFNATLFIANDETMLNQSLDRAQNPVDTAINFRDGQMYKNALQPILKNPQLAASMRLRFSPEIKGISSFSKHRFATTTETQFQFIFE